MAQAWREGIGWLGSGPGMLAAFLALQLLLAILILPLWLRFLDRQRWRGMQRELVREALALHVAGTDAVAVLVRQLLGEGPPLARLQKLRRAIEDQRAARGRFAEKLAVHSGAMTAPLARLAGGAIDFADASADTVARVTRLYLKEAGLRLASNVVHGEDILGFAPGQIVALPWLAELEDVAATFAAAEAENRERLSKALGWRARRDQSDTFAVSAEAAENLAIAIRQLAAGLHAADPESLAYRNRNRELSFRTLDGLIARFDRGGTIGSSEPR